MKQQEDIPDLQTKIEESKKRVDDIDIERNAIKISMHKLQQRNAQYNSDATLVEHIIPAIEWLKI